MIVWINFFKKHVQWKQYSISLIFISRCYCSISELSNTIQSQMTEIKYLKLMYEAEFQKKLLYQLLIRRSYRSVTILLIIVSTYTWYIIYFLLTFVKNAAKCAKNFSNVQRIDKLITTYLLLIILNPTYTYNQ